MSAKAKRICNICGKSFSRSDCMKFTKHQRLAHGIDRHKSRYIWTWSYQRPPATSLLPVLLPAGSARAD